MKSLLLFIAIVAAFGLANAADIISSMPNTAVINMQNAVVLTTGEAGFARKIEMIKKAKKDDQLKLAYFIFEDDFSSSYLAKRLIEKANAGVKVQLLVDSVMAEKFRPWLSFLSTTSANLEVREFRGFSDDFRVFLKDRLQVQNPEMVWQGLALQNTQLLAGALMSSPYLLSKVQEVKEIKAAVDQMKAAPGNSASSPADQLNGNPLQLMNLLASRLSRMDGKDKENAQLLTKHIYEFTMRMHHKLMVLKSKEIVDGKVITNLEVINGGRNISDEYHLSFGNNLLKGRNYPFFDIEMAGSVKGPKEQEAILSSFNRLWSGFAFVKPIVMAKELNKAEVKANMSKRAEAYAKEQHSLEANKEKGTMKVGSIKVNYAENLPDLGYGKRNDKMIQQSWIKMIEKARVNITVPTAYFFFESAILDAMVAAAKRGVQIRIYTNSAASTDMNIVNIGVYLRMEDWMEKFGDGAKNIRFFELSKAQGQGSLHAKMFSIDGSVLMIGSANMDPRTTIYDSNNAFFFEPGMTSGLVNNILSRYLDAKDPMGHNLEWFEINQKYATDFLASIQEKQGTLLRALSLREFQLEL